MIGQRSGTSDASGAHFAFTDRWGGVSAVPYEELNLGGAVGDDPDAVRTNRELAAKSLGLDPDRVVWMNQVHGNDVAEVDGPWGDAPRSPRRRRRGHRHAAASPSPSSPPTAPRSCSPTRSPGWSPRPTRAGPAWSPGSSRPRSTPWSRSAPTPARIVARTGPAVCGRCYEVPEEMRAEVAAVEPAAYAETELGHPGGRRDRRGARAAGAARGARPAAVAGVHAGVRRPLLVPPRPHHRAARRLCLAGLIGHDGP